MLLFYTYGPSITVQQKVKVLMIMIYDDRLFHDSSLTGEQTERADRTLGWS